MSNNLIIGVTGKKRSGKDTFARRLVREHGFTRLAFADALKAAAADLNPFVEVTFAEWDVIHGGPGAGFSTDWVRLSELLDSIGWERAKDVADVRRTLQALGVAMREAVSPSVWVDVVAARAAATTGPVVVTDVRFPEEVEWVRRCGGLMVRVVRPGLGLTDAHESETALDNAHVDFTIGNDGSLADLGSWADTIARFALGSTRP